MRLVRLVVRLGACTEPLYYGPGALVWCAIDYVDPVCVTEMLREQTGG